jgi:hypothetical protein
MVQHWTGNHFEDVQLKSLGIKVHLGHNGGLCPMPGNIVENFTVVDTNGIHSVDIHFCGCYATAGGSLNRIQLLRVGLLPPTHTRPTSAFTFDVLDSFHLLTLQGKTSAYDYYLALAHKSDNTGLLDTKVCLPFCSSYCLTFPLVGSLRAVSDIHANLAPPQDA